MSSGYTVVLGALDVVANGIQSVLDELGNLGINGQQESGSPIEDVALSIEDAGSLQVSQIVSDGLGRAHYALRTALANATQMVGMLRQIKTEYQHAETGAADLFGQISKDITAARRAVPAPPQSLVSGGSPNRVAPHLVGGAG